MAKRLTLETGDRIMVWNERHIGSKYTFDSMFGDNDAIVVRKADGELEIIRDWCRITILEEVKQS